ncbi:MAG TPA: NADP-dependent oxidoreductase [Mycobacteriales bacterium]
MTTTSREIHLVRRPQGAAVPDDFALRTADVPDPGEGEVTVRNLFMSVDPYMRGRMNDVKSYVPPFALDAVMQGGAVGRVVASRDRSVPEGALVTSGNGWREAFTAPARHVQVVPDRDDAAAYLGVLGMPGMTAWAGVEIVAPVREGDVVFVSAASGAVGSIAGQLARARGASRVVGSAGAPEKCRAVESDFGFDVCFSYRDGQPLRALREAAPDGIDVYFDNVGGAQLNAALIHARMNGRFALCGGISSGYDGSAGEPVTALGMAVGLRLNLRGFIVSDYADRQEDFLREVGGLLEAGKITARQTVFDGIDHAVEAFLGLFAGGSQIGKVVVAV